MNELHFVRLTTGWAPDYYYEVTTDVWVFGDVPGYRSFQHALRQASTGDRIVRPPVLGLKQNSMRVIILPAACAPRVRPRLKLYERVVFHRPTPEMQLVFYGNAAGYQLLNECFERVIATYRNDPSEHLHVEDHRAFSGFLVPRSVSLNIRGPLHPWSREALGPYAPLVYERQPSYLPPEAADLKRSDCPYHDPVPGGYPMTLS